MKHTFLTAEYSVKCDLGGTFDEYDEYTSEEQLRRIAKQRLMDELADLVLKRPPEEFDEFFTITLHNVVPVEVEDGL